LPSRAPRRRLSPTPSSKRATPPVGGTVGAPKEIRLELSEGVEPKFTGVTLTSASGATVPVGPAKTEAGNAALLIVPIAKPLAPGVYTVRWHADSVDTHHTQGEF
jgi:methionine-rich copper-binding protein CopC